MKKTLITLAVFLATTALSNAQIKAPNLKSVKEKATEKVDQIPSGKGTSSSDSGTKETPKLNGEPAYDPDSPTYNAFSIARDGISSARNVMKDENWNKNIEGRNDDAVGYLKKAQDNIVKLQNDPGEAKKQYLKDLQTSWDEVEALRKQKFDTYSMDKSYSEKLDQYHRFATSGWEISDKTLEPSYTGYNNFRKEFEAQRVEYFKDNYVQSRVAAIDNFFKVEVYKVVPLLDQDVESIIKRIHEINGRGEQSYLLNADNYVEDFKKPLEEIAYNRAYLLEDKTSIDAVKAKIDKELAMLNEYISSGKFEAHVAKYRQEIIDAVRVGAKKMSNPKYEAMAIAGVDKGKGTRAVITSDVWLVKKNEYGYPLYKYLPIDITVTHEGKCWLAYGQIKKEYEGGGVYGGEFFDFWGLQDEMNCANTLK